MRSTHQEWLVVYVLKGNAYTLSYKEKRILGHMVLDADLVMKTLVKATEQSTTSSEIDAVLNDVYHHTMQIERK